MTNMSESHFDVVILGGGPGGYRAAERAGNAGKSVALVEKEHLGGVCLNRGCIPTKTLLHSAKLYVHGKEGAQFGVTFGEAAYDISTAMRWKQQVVETMRKGIVYQMKRFGVEVIQGEGTLIDRRTIAVGDKRLTADSIVLATGSSTLIIPIEGAQSDLVKTSTEVLELSELPKSIVIIGGGVIGMEFASYFASLEVEVHVIEMLDEIIPVLDVDISSALRKAMKNINFHLGAKVEAVKDTGVQFTQNGESKTVSGDIVLMSVGRKPNVEGIGLENAGIEYSGKGVAVNEYMQTNIPGVYAVGDLTGKSLLAHSAYRMADVAVNKITETPGSTHSDRMRYHAIPWVVYTMPEAAGCGISEREARESGLEINTAVTQMRANGRFFAEHGKGPGLCKVVTDKNTGRLLGVHMLGEGCSEHIFGAAAMIEAELRDRDIAEIVFPHPSVSEIILDTIRELAH